MNGELWIVPPDVPPAFVAELIARGVMRVEDEPKKSRKEDRS
jgi:hypothetical protein